MPISATRSRLPRKVFARSIVPFTLPIGSEANFKGVVDVVHQKAYRI